MNVVFSTGRPAHAVLPANLLAARGARVTIYSTAYRSRFRGLSPTIDLRWAPQFVAGFHFLTGVQLPRPMQRADTAAFDQIVARRIGACDLFWGWASGALAAGRAARQRGARFVLDRACPHVDVQQRLVREECDRLEVAYTPEPAWFHARQVAEYEEADVILVPSDYSRRSFPSELQGKIITAPLFGRVPRPANHAPASSVSRPFTFGTVAGQPLRKGLLYLLEAWSRLQLPHARLLVRTSADLSRFPALRRILARLKNVEIAGYFPDMTQFYTRCDAFVFPTADDGFGMSLIEAMAHGLPAIASDHCGAAELFTAGRDLLVVAARDPLALAGAMEQLYDSRELQHSLASSAFERLRQIESRGEYRLYSDALDQVLTWVPAAER